jgi:hypothetical protein
MRRWSLGTAVLAAFTFGASPLAAQSVSVGPMGGASFFTFNGSDSDIFSDPDVGVGLDKGTRVGFAAGAFAEFELGSRWAIEPQLLYVQKGAKYSGTLSDPDLGDVDVSTSLNTDYIQIPVLFKAEFRNPSSTVTPSVFVGPAFGFNIGCSISADAGDLGSADADCDDDTVKSTEFSAVFGAGIEFNRFSLQGRYDLGLSEIAEGADVKNGGFLITLGYAFRLR